MLIKLPKERYLDYYVLVSEVEFINTKIDKGYILQKKSFNPKNCHLQEINCNEQRSIYTFVGSSSY